MQVNLVRKLCGIGAGMYATVLLLCNMAAGMTYYVAPHGDDAWSGLLAEANTDHSDGPLASLDGARLKVRHAKTKDASIPITVMVRGGEYRLVEYVIGACLLPASAGEKTTVCTMERTCFRVPDPAN